jgi:RNA methyltransferase, TrmH family
MIITSPHNDKLKLIHRLARRRSRERDGLFVAEGEDLLAAARAAGAEPVELLSAAGTGLGGTEVEPELLDRFSSLGSGTRVIGVWRQLWSDRPAPPAVYLHGVADPGNVGTVVRTAQALVGGSVVLGPDCADPFGPRAVRASMGAVFSEPLVRADVGSAPAPRAALVAHGGEPLERLFGAMTICLGAERVGLPPDVLEACETQVTIPLRPGAESLNVAAAAAIALQQLCEGAPQAEARGNPTYGASGEGDGD